MAPRQVRRQQGRLFCRALRAAGQLTTSGLAAVIAACGVVSATPVSQVRPEVASAVPGQIIGYRASGAPIRLMFGGAGPAVVQAVSASGTSLTSLSFTLASTGAGNCLLVVVYSNASTDNPGISGVTLGGSAGNFASSGASVGGATAAFGFLTCWIDPDCAGGQTALAVTMSGGSGTVSVVGYALEISGCALSSVVDKIAPGGDSTSSATFSSGTTSTTSQASEIAVGLCGGSHSSSVTIGGPSSPWTNETQVNQGNTGLVVSYNVLSSTGTVTYSGSLTSGSTYAATAITLKALTAVSGSAALSAAASVSAAGHQTLQQAAALSASASVTAAGHETVHEAAALSAAASVSAVPPYTPPPVTAQNLTAELQLSAWTDITGYVYQRDTVALQLGRQNEASTLQACTATMTLNNRDFRFTTRNPAGAYYPDLVQNTPLRLSVPAAAYYRSETDLASYVSCPDSSALQITSGTLSLRIDCQLTDWQGNHQLINKSTAWGMWTNGDGTVEFEHIDGSSGSHASVSPRLPYFSGRIAIRVDYNISAQTVTWYTAPDMAGSWTQLGPAGSTTATTQASGSGNAVVISNDTLPGIYGNVYEAQILQTGTLKADPVFTAQSPGATSFSDTQGNTWTLTGTGEISGRLYRFHGEMSAVPKAADPSGTDVYSQATAYGVSQRLQNANTPLNSPMYRAYVRLPADLNLAAYWPCEDGTSATTIGSAVGSAPMQILTIAGSTPELAANSDFACSSPIPAMNGGSLYAKVPSGVSFTDAVIRALVSIPAGGDTDGAVILQALYSGGTVAYADLVFGSVGPDLTMNAYNAAGSLIYSMGPVSGLIASGGQYRVSMNLKANGSGVDMEIETLAPGASEAQTFTHTLASSAVGAATVVQTGPCMSAMGHVSVQGTWDTLFDLAGALNAWSGETAGTRVARLCSEEGITCRIMGPPETSAPMGYQAIDTLYDILEECENTDLGMLFEPRQVLGLGYRTLKSLYHQPALATASYSASELFQGFGSTGDTQLTVNDVTAQAPDGSTARQFLATGAMSVQDPPDGIGRISTQIQPNPQLDLMLNQIAAWYLSVRSVDDDRYPEIPFVINRAQNPPSVLLLNAGDLLQVTGTPDWLPPPPVSQLAAGFTETFFPGPYYLLQVNGIPELPYETAVFDTARFDTDGSTLTSSITSTATSFSVTLGSGVRRWTTTAGSFPFDIVIDREQMTVSGITGTGPQTFTVTRSVNGVTIPHSAGAAVALYHKPLLAL